MKKYQIILADPPWDLKRGSPNLHAVKQGNRPLPYNTMTVEQIKKLDINSISESDSVLFLWTTNKYLRDAFDVAISWGFAPSTTLVWCKKPKGRGLGGTFGISTEFIIFARKGSLKSKDRYWSTWIEHKRLSHSEKPQLFRDIICKCFDGNKIELFARSTKKVENGWVNVGDSVDGCDIRDSIKKIIDGTYL